MICLERITKRFGEKTVFEDFSYSFQEGVTTCIMGPSGCGKTTLLALASGLLAPDAGRILTKKARASYVFQEDRLLPWSNALSNITVLGIPEETALASLAEVGLLDERCTMPDSLSGGMRRRLAIARSLAFGGDVFFLDEPMRGLDPQTAEMVLRAIKKSLLGKTALLVTHQANEAEALGHDILKL